MPTTSPASITRSPANLIGIDYRAVPPRKVGGEIIDAHCHVHAGKHAELFFEAAATYGVTRVLSMSPLMDVQRLRDAYGDRIRFIAIPNWKAFANDEQFRRDWLADLTRFRELGARVCKFWMAPPMRAQHQLTLDHSFLRPVIDHVLGLDYHFMVHVGDPSVWWNPGGKYADASRFGTKEEQYDQLRWLCDYVAPRTVIAAHLGGFVESPEFLQGLLDAHPNLVLDSSATKWIVREVARRPDAVRELIVRNPTRIVFGSDLVANEKYTDFDHYASRYWAHLMMWESAYRGESPIEDPDAEGSPRLAGLDLPKDALLALYSGNIRRLGLAD